MVLAEAGFSVAESARWNGANWTEAYAGPENVPLTAEVAHAAWDERMLSADDRFRDKSFVGPKQWKGDGDIIESKDEKLNLSTGDLVYTNLGSYDVKEGEICDVFRKGNEITDPKTGKLIGYEIRHIGTLQIIGNVGVNSSLARIEGSREAIQIGDEIKLIARPAEGSAGN